MNAIATRALLTAMIAGAAPLIAQKQAPVIIGTWRVDAGTEVKNGPREVVIRTDSSASWGKETVRWRVVDQKIWIAIGGEWEIYDLRLRATELRLSGGDLKQPVTLRRIGPPTPRASNIPVPPVPDGE